MAIKPILFNTEMVRAILDGRDVWDSTRNQTSIATVGMRILTFG